MKSPYEIAREEFLKHIQEVAGKGNNERIIEYHACTTLHADTDEVPWCSSFVNFCVRESILSGYNIQHGTKSASARSWLHWGEETKTPQEGDIVIFKRGNDSYKGHVAFFQKQLGDLIYCLGGNQSDSVCIKPYGKENILGFRKAII